MSAVNRTQLIQRKEEAARFVRNVLGDPARADEIEDESLEDYAGRRGIEIVENPRGGFMATKDDLQERIQELEEENDELQDQLDQIADLAAPVDEDDDEATGARPRPTQLAVNPRRRLAIERRDIGRTRRNAGR